MFFLIQIFHISVILEVTSNLCFYCKLIYSELKFDLDVENKMKYKTITFDIFTKAYENKYCVNKPKPHVNMSYLSMYC
jgi:hypothetical protein